MEAVTEYIKRNSNGRKQPIRGSTIASAFGVSGVRVRNMVNSARCKGDPICSNGNGYYIARDKSEIENTIASMKGRIMQRVLRRSGNFLVSSVAHNPSHPDAA